ncbi:hypothetical protein BGLA2_530031 [Burkholderia gladioli]|nr:hypothetical protein BGLA2_530031 [Burkholderia gladioli]
MPGLSGPVPLLSRPPPGAGRAAGLHRGAEGARRDARLSAGSSAGLSAYRAPAPCDRPRGAFPDASFSLRFDVDRDARARRTGLRR